MRPAPRWSASWARRSGGGRASWSTRAARGCATTSSPIRAAFALLVGAALGGSIGGALFLASALALGAASSPEAALGDPRMSMWVLGAAFAGFVAAAEVAHVRVVRATVRTVAGAVAGAAAGTAVYALGYAAVFHAENGLSSALLAGVAEGLLSATVLEAGLAGVGALIGMIAASYGWRLSGFLAYLGLCAVAGGYVLYALTVSLPQTPRESLPVSLFLFFAESATLGLVVVYAFYSLDVFQRKRWERAPQSRPFSPFYLPRVAFHVAAFNEPTDLLRGTLDALTRLDYPRDRYVVMVADDSTEPEAAKALEQMCAERGFTYIHRTDRRGFKAGALNNALRQTPADVEIVAVLDADYQVKPEFLKETVGFFIDPNLGFLQTPQDYRNRDETFLTRQYYLADSYFYRAILPSRNEGNAIIFCGTMGMVRRRTLEAVGGWGEGFITEDAELSFRIFHAGWDALYVNKTYGLGLIPPTYDAYKKQHTRWAFGCVKVLRAYAGRTMFSRMSVRQKCDFILGNLHWFDGLFTLVIACALVALAVGDAVGMRPVTHHERDIALLAFIPIFLLLDGVLRLHGALRSALKVTPFDTLRTLGMWFSIKFATSFAALKSLLGAKMPFVRTPKAPNQNLTRGAALARAVQLTKFESAMALVLLASSVLTVHGALKLGDPSVPGYLARLILGAWCVYYAALFLTAPSYAYLSYRTFREEPGAAVAAPAPA